MCFLKIVVVVFKFNVFGVLYFQCVFVTKKKTENETRKCFRCFFLLALYVRKKQFSKTVMDRVWKIEIGDVGLDRAHSLRKQKWNFLAVSEKKWNKKNK